MIKEKAPEETIKNINNILNIKKINYKIIRTNKHYNNFYSGSVKIINTNIATNGKGLTENFSIASMLAELMERLSNNMFYFKWMKSYIKSPFLFQPDEISIDTINNILLPEYNQASKLFQNINNDDESTICLPYKNYKNDTITYIPRLLSRYIYGSNGMASGNSFEEAFMQALFEIFERKIQQQFILGQIQATLIPIEKLQNFIYYNDIQIIQNLGYKINFFDFYNTTKFPVVACQIIALDNPNFCTIKFGSHSNFMFAIERTLTEIFQSNLSLKYLTHRNILVNENDKLEINPKEFCNIRQIFQDGQGFYFQNSFNNILLNFKDWPNFPKDNKKLMEIFLNYLESLNLNVLYRDTSFLDFPSCYIIIPTFSEIAPLDQHMISTIQILEQNRTLVMPKNEQEINAIQNIYNAFKN